MSNFLSEFPLPSMLRHSSSSALTRRSSASTVISASRYETNAPPHRDFGIREVPDDVEVVAVGEYLKETTQNVNYLFMYFKPGVSDALLLSPTDPCILFWLHGLFIKPAIYTTSLCIAYTYLKFGARSGYEPLCLVMRQSGICARVHN